MVELVIILEEVRQEVTQEGNRQELAQEGSRQEVAQEGSEEKETEVDENEPWQQQGRHRFECPICGLGRRTKCQVEQHMNIHDKPEEDSQFNCKDCQFQTMNRDQLYQHMEMIHKKIECNLCNTFFNTRKNLNVHRHETHRKIYKPCRNFPSKNCEYDSECSFYHVILN